MEGEWRKKKDRSQVYKDLVFVLRYYRAQNGENGVLISITSK
jgi:hypothetical protein